MAFPDSYVNARAIRDSVSGIGMNLNTDTFKMALFTDSVPNSTNMNIVETYGSGPWSTIYEVTGDGYVTGGKDIGGISVGVPAGGMWRFQSNQQSILWENASFTARGALVYNTTRSNQVLCAINFGEDKTALEGNFRVVYDYERKIFYGQHIQGG